MVILTEKPNVTKDFAKALSCTFSNGVYKNASTIITNCKGHLFSLEEPSHYGNEIPIIPEKFDYCTRADVADQAKLVIEILKKHKTDSILIATDADREGEVIARECLLMAGITDFSNIKRFWVSEALTYDVIIEGIKNAKPLTEYNKLSEQGFARQEADWLVGMNFCRYLSSAANRKLVVGRVQTAILSAIEQRENLIKNFVSQKYFQHYGIFGAPRGTSNCICSGLYFYTDENKIKYSSFDNVDKEENLKSCIGKQAKLVDSKTEKKSQKPPQLYNLISLQKDAYKSFGYTAEQTLNIVQVLYEKLKCVSYPRTPSKVMGSGNVELCKKIADDLCKNYYTLANVRLNMDISLNNKHCFDDSKLDAHHALIPLKPIPENATEEEKNIFILILIRFFLSFLPTYEYEKQTFILNVDSNLFEVSGKKTLNQGWKSKDFSVPLENLLMRHVALQNDNEVEEDNEQELSNINWNALTLTNVDTKEKWTKPPTYFNEASILSFMENPKFIECHVAHEENSDKKLVGLGTAATRHTFIPKLIKNGYIELKDKKFICTQLGDILLKAVRSSPVKSLADISETTNWEEKLENNPSQFLFDIKDFVKNTVSQKLTIDIPLNESNNLICPLCHKILRKGKSNYFCSGYINGCKFVIWENIVGAKLSQKDVESLCNGKQTGIKHCTNKVGKKFSCYFELDDKGQVKFSYENKIER